MKPWIYRKNMFKKEDKAGTIISLIIIIAITIMFAVLFFNCIRAYSEFDIGYDDLTYEELTFDKFKIIDRRKRNDIYEIYFKEYSEPFYISGIVLEKLDKDSLIELKQGEIAKVYYCQSSHRDYDHSICEMSCDSVVILSLQGYVEANQDNQTVGMIVCLILVLCGLFPILYIVFWLKHTRKKL